MPDMNQNNIKESIDKVIQRTIETSGKETWPAIRKAQQFLYQEFNIASDDSSGYWVSALIQNDSDKKAWLLSMSSGAATLEEAMEIISNIRKNHNALAVWVDTFTEYEDETQWKMSKTTVYHEYFVDCFGNIS